MSDDDNGISDDDNGDADDEGEGREDDNGGWGDTGLTIGQGVHRLQGFLKKRFAGIPVGSRVLYGTTWS